MKLKQNLLTIVSLITIFILSKNIYVITAQEKESTLSADIINERRDKTDNIDATDEAKVEPIIPITKDITSTDKVIKQVSPSVLPVLSPTLSPALSPSNTPVPVITELNSISERKTVELKGSFKDKLKQIGVDSAKKKYNQRISQSNSVNKQQRANHIISLELNKLTDEEKNKLLSYFIEISSKGKYLEYLELNLEKNNTDLFYFLLHDTKDDDLKEIKESLEQDKYIKVGKNRKYIASYIPNDKYHMIMSHFGNLDWNRAMDRGINTSVSVPVAVIDSGVKMTDLDFKNRIWVNSDESVDGIDNDGNGYIDDINGCNFHTGSCNSSGMLGTGDSHGTYVATFIGNVINNGYGGAAVCPNCQVMVLDVADGGSGSDIGTIAQAMDYAVDNGAKVINLSLSSYCPFDTSEDYLAPQIDYIININNVSIVQAAGNQGQMTESECLSNCPSNVHSYCRSSAKNETYYHVDGKDVNYKVNVAATDTSDARSTFSNYDSSKTATTIAAPGEGLSAVVDNVYIGDVSGTSFAVPQVSAALGLAYGRYAMNGKAPTTMELYNLIRNTADSISTDKNVSGKRLNLYNMILEADNLAGVPWYPVYRFWSDEKQAHFYTISPAERDDVVNNYPDNVWRYEGIAYYAFSNKVNGTIPIYRFWSDKYQGHFYTASESEKNSVIANYPDNVWYFEGVAYYAYPLNSSVGNTVYRFWSDKKGHHFYTASVAEKDHVIANYPDNVWRHEGPVWKVK
jgi:hypothetical protein